MKLTCEMLLAENKFKWANWVLVGVMTHKQQVQHAIFAAELVLDIFEQKYPQDKRPREAILAATKCLRSSTKVNGNIAADVAYAAAYAADAKGAGEEARIKIVAYGLKLLD